MDIKIYDENIPFIIIDDFYDNYQLNSIWREFDFLYDKLEYPTHSSVETIRGAVDDNGSMLKNNKSVWLDVIYPYRNISNILTHNRKFFYNWKSIFSGSKSWWIQSMGECSHIFNMDSTLLAYYEDDSYYKIHVDTSVISTCTWFYREPKGFDGGDFIINPNDRDIGKELSETYLPSEIKIRNNRMVIFPSCIPHKVLPIKMKDEYKDMKGMGRFSLTNFIKVKN